MRSPVPTAHDFATTERAQPKLPPVMDSMPIRQLVDILHVDLARRGEDAAIGEIGALANFNGAEQFGNDEIGVGIALAMRVRRHVDRHAVDPQGDVVAVVEREAAQEILIRFARTGMLRDKQARERFRARRPVARREWR